MNELETLGIGWCLAEYGDRAELDSNGTMRPLLKGINQHVTWRRKA
jgi:hypothetical protein